MKTILTTLNSKYTHTSLALRVISNWLKQREIEVEWVEYTINTPIYTIIGNIYRQKPDVLIFSVYIWNAKESRQIAAQLKKLLPETLIVFGGPEVSFDSAAELKAYPFVDFITRGEGESVTEHLLRELGKLPNERNFKTILGLTWRDEVDIIVNGDQQPLLMDLSTFPYPDLEQLSHRILYYESSRGCPFNCSYCLSSATKGVRFRSDELVRSDLMCFIAAKVAQVKFIDRTFNANPNRALELWKFLADEDLGYTNFHFEITAELLRDEDIAFLKTVRIGLFQFEIGIQTTMEEASEAVNRRLSFHQLKVPVKTLLEAGNIHIHVDLIAGLPHEGYERFLQSFDDVYALNPHVLQLGFLKLIKGSEIRRNSEKHAYIFEDYQPYEVLQTKYISFDEMLMLKDLEESLEHLHNSKRFAYTLKYMMAIFERPSQFFVEFSMWLRKQGYFEEAIKLERWYELIWMFCVDQNSSQVDLLILRASLLLDYMSSLGKQPPEWLSGKMTTDVKSNTFELVKNKSFGLIFPHLAELSAKESVKKIRYAGATKALIDAMKQILLDRVIIIQTKVCLEGILIVELSEKHVITERYETYLFIEE